MPQARTLQSNIQTIDQQLLEADLGYEYPDDADYRPGSEMHGEHLRRLMYRIDRSYEVMSSRYESWKKIDQNLTAYIPQDEAEKVVRNEDSRRPTSIVVPASFAIKETILTHLVSTFFDDFIYPLEGVGPEDVIGGIKFQHELQAQANKEKHELDLYIQWDDALRYGLGILVPEWKTTTRQTMSSEPVGYVQPDGSFVQTGENKTPVTKVAWEGHCLHSIDPYRYFPDPNVPPHKIQRAEYVAWLDTWNYYDLLDAEDKGDLGFFNVKYLKAIKGRSKWAGEDSGRFEHNGVSPRTGGSDAWAEDCQVDIVHVYIKILPREWSINPNEQVQKWLFSFASDRIIIRALQVDEIHDRFPVSVVAPDFDGYSPTPVSRMEVTYGLQEGIDWFYNSRIKNVRKAINNVLIADPYRIRVEDLMVPEPKVVRTRHPVWGEGVSNSVMQLQIQDVTQGHINDIANIEEMMQRVTGAVDSLQGIMRKGGERRSATEARNTHSGALSRLNKMAMLIGVQGQRDLTYLLAEQTKEMKSQESWIRLQGDWPQVLMAEYGINPGDIRNNRLLVEPQDLDINYDIVPVEVNKKGSEYIDNWIQLYQVIIGNPELMMTMDSTRIFFHIARLMGTKNIQQFRRLGVPALQQQVVPDEEAADARESGRLTPTSQAASNRGY